MYWRIGMLEKISNISTKTSFKNKKRTKNFQEYFQKSYIEKPSGKDAIILSPAVLFLNKINWQLKEITFPSEEKIHLNFSIQEFEFNTEIDFLDFYNTNRQLFKIIKTGTPPANRDKTFIGLSIKKEILEIFDKLHFTDINGIRMLLERVGNLHIDGEIGKNDTFVLDNLMEGIEEQINEDFKDIMNSIYTFIDKLNKFNLINGYEFESDDSPHIIIEKIISLNG